MLAKEAKRKYLNHEVFQVLVIRGVVIRATANDFVHGGIQNELVNVAIVLLSQIKNWTQLVV
jgi:hypothetical protein